MHRIMMLLGLCAAMTALSVGCANDSQQVQRPKHPEDFRAPPETDPRYSRPIEYPKDAMEQDTLLKKAKDAAKGNNKGGGMMGTGGGPGMGGPGGPSRY